MLGMKVKKVETFDIGDSVLCDGCNKEFRGNPASGGLLFGSKAYCPECAPDMDAKIARFEEQRYINGRCPPNQSFHSWVMGLRAGNNTITMTVYE
jgi:hypothetical protein